MSSLSPEIGREDGAHHVVPGGIRMHFVRQRPPSPDPEKARTPVKRSRVRQRIQDLVRASFSTFPERSRDGIVTGLEHSRPRWGSLPMLRRPASGLETALGAGDLHTVRRWNTQKVHWIFEQAARERVTPVREG